MDVEGETTTQLQQVQLCWNPAAAKVIIDIAALTFLQGDRLSGGLNLHQTGRVGGNC